MVSRKEEFEHGNFGIFAGSEGLANINEMDVEQAPDYYSMTRTCEGCGERRECQVPWAELYCLQYAVNPAEVGRAIHRNDVFNTSWVYDPRPQLLCFHPQHHCGCNGNPLIIFNMTPFEAERVLKAAGRNGIISDAQQRVMASIAQTVKQLSRGVAIGQPQMPPQQVPPGYQQQAQGYGPGYPPQQQMPQGFRRR